MQDYKKNKIKKTTFKKGAQVERIQKALARAGVASRRKVEEMIVNGEIKVNGKIAQLGDIIDVNDTTLRIKVGNDLVSLSASNKQSCRVIIYNKRIGEISTEKDPEGRVTVFERLPNLSVGRWIQIGRLDLNTSGLLLFTNDGELANKLMHPSSKITRTYLCRIFGDITLHKINNLKKGVELEDGLAKFSTLKEMGGFGANAWYEVSLNEGRNREVRRLWETQDLIVSRLMRKSFGSIELPMGLPQGGWLEANLQQINSLRKLVNLSLETKSFVEIVPMSKSTKKLKHHQQVGKIRKVLSKQEFLQTPIEKRRPMSADKETFINNVKEQRRSKIQRTLALDNEAVVSNYLDKPKKKKHK